MGLVTAGKLEENKLPTCLGARMALPSDDDGPWAEEAVMALPTAEGQWVALPTADQDLPPDVGFDAELLGGSPKANKRPCCGKKCEVTFVEKFKSELHCCARACGYSLRKTPETQSDMYF